MGSAALADIRDFLGRKRLLVVGVSREPKHFTRRLFRELRDRGYDAVPVNPHASEVDGVPCLARVADADPPAETVLLLTNPAVTGGIAVECAEAGVKAVWMYRAPGTPAGTGAVNPSAAAFWRSRGIRVIEGECPFMFFENTEWPHRLHGFCRKVFGGYPQ